MAEVKSSSVNRITTLEIPRASVKRVMKLNQEVPNISAEAVVVVAKVTEDFIRSLAKLSKDQAANSNRRTIKVEDIVAAINQQGPKLEFLDEAFGVVSKSKIDTKKSSK